MQCFQDWFDHLAFEDLEACPSLNLCTMHCRLCITQNPLDVAVALRSKSDPDPQSEQDVSVLEIQGGFEALDDSVGQARGITQRPHILYNYYKLVALHSKD